jgi:EpsI family protein
LIRPDGRAIAARLRPALPVLAITALVTVALWPSPGSLLRYWESVHDYQHGYLIATIVLAWMARELWRGASRGLHPSLPASVLLAPVLLVWIVAARGGIDIAHQLLWPVALGMAIWAVAGTGTARRLIPAVGLLYAAIPVWDYGLPVLQRLSIFFSEHILGLLGVPATVTEYRVTIPEGTFAIVEGCSGKRFLVVTLAVAYLTTFVNHLRGWRALCFLAAAALLSMVTNWIRIVIIIYAGHVSNMQHYLVANEHLSLGNAMFVPLILGVILLGRWLGREHGPVPVADTATGPVAGRMALVPVGILLLTAAVVRLDVAGHGKTLLGPMPVATDRWQGPIPPQAGWRPAYKSADDERRAMYASVDGQVEIYANLYTSQRKNQELIHYGNNIIAPALWTQPWSDSEGSLTAGKTNWAVQRMQGPDQRVWLVAHTYLVGGHSYRTDTSAKLAYGWRSLFGAAPAGVLAAAAVCDEGNCDKARMLVADFWENMRPLMQAMMPSGAQRAP